MFNILVIDFDFKKHYFLSVCQYVYMIFTYVCVYVCVCVLKYVCVCVCVCVCYCLFASIMLPFTFCFPVIDDLVHIRNGESYG